MVGNFLFLLTSNPIIRKFTILEMVIDYYWHKIPSYRFQFHSLSTTNCTRWIRAIFTSLLLMNGAWSVLIAKPLTILNQDITTAPLAKNIFVIDQNKKAATQTQVVFLPNLVPPLNAVSSESIQQNNDTKNPITSLLHSQIRTDRHSPLPKSNVGTNDSNANQQLGRQSLISDFTDLSLLKSHLKSKFSRVFANPNDKFNPPNTMVVSEFGGRMINAISLFNTIINKASARQANEFGLAPSWNNSGVSISGAIGKLFSSQRKISIFHIGYSINSEEQPNFISPYFGIRGSISSNFNELNPDEKTPKDFKFRSMVGVILHQDLSDGQWAAMRIVLVEDINATQIPKISSRIYKLTPPQTSGYLIDLDLGIKLFNFYGEPALVPHYNYDSIGKNNDGIPSQSLTINLRWRL